MTETGMITSNPLHGERRPGSVGHPLPGVELRIGGDDGRVLGPGADRRARGARAQRLHGLLAHAGEDRRGVPADGFFITGDVGRIGAGRLCRDRRPGQGPDHLGRLNVYPKEVESVLDDAAGVVESAVIGVPHPDFGEAVVAVVVRRRAARRGGVIAAARARLAASRCPSGWCSSTSCRATPWARCRRTCCARATRMPSRPGGRPSNGQALRRIGGADGAICPYSSIA